MMDTQNHQGHDTRALIRSLNFCPGAYLDLPRVRFAGNLSSRTYRYHPAYLRTCPSFLAARFPTFGLRPPSSIFLVPRPRP